MKEKVLYCIWACMYVLCVGLAFITEPQSATKVALVIIALLFFVPGAVILYDALKANDRKAILRIRLISALSLGLTMLMIVITFLCITASEAVGEALYELLILVSAPMVCGQYWILSLFLWACLLTASFTRKAKKSVDF